MSGKDTASFRRALDAWDDAFAEGDIDAFAGLLADDVQLMWHYRETITGKENVVEAFGGVFSSIDTSAWKADHHTVEVHDNTAYVLSDFTEDLLPYDGSPGRRVFGRAVLFYRKEDGRWLITRALSARSAPEKPIDR